MAGSAAVWLLFLTMFFIVVLVYNFFSFPLATIQPTIEDLINDTLNNSTSSIQTNASSTIDTLDVSWTYWPLLMIFGLFIWAMAASVKTGNAYD